MYSSQRLKFTVCIFSLIVIYKENIFILEMTMTVSFHWLRGTSAGWISAEKQSVDISVPIISLQLSCGE